MKSKTDWLALIISEVKVVGLAVNCFRTSEILRNLPLKRLRLALEWGLTVRECQILITMTFEKYINKFVDLATFQSLVSKYLSPTLRYRFSHGRGQRIWFGRLEKIPSQPEKLILF